MKHNYEVVVGNIGYVYSGSLLRDAKRKFATYKRQSERCIGRASSEAVTLFKDGEISQEFEPETTVTAWVGSAWYRDCDAFMCIAFNPGRRPYATARKASDKLERLALSSATDDWNGCDSGQTKREFLSDVCHSGVSLETNVQLTEEQRGDFYGTQGYCYFEGL